MTAIQEKQLLEDVADMKSALLGTLDNKRVGVVHRTAQHEDDINGTEKDPTSGLKFRIRQLEETKIKIFAMAAGASIVVTCIFQAVEIAIRMIKKN